MKYHYGDKVTVDGYPGTWTVHSPRPRVQERGYWLEPDDDVAVSLCTLLSYGTISVKVQDIRSRTTNEQDTLQ